MSARAAFDALRARGWMLVTAESCTAGLIAGAITDIAGSSAILDRGFVTYSNAAKTQMLGIPSDVINTHGAVSRAVVQAMSVEARARSIAQISVAVTGIAGPGGSDHKPEGRVWFGVDCPDGSHVEMVDFGAIGRDLVRASTVAHALSLVARITKHGPPN